MAGGKLKIKYLVIDNVYNFFNDFLMKSEKSVLYFL